MIEDCVNTVFVRGLEVKACHGVHDFEKVESQRFIIGAELQVAYSRGAFEDKLEGTVSYSEACRVISGVATENSFNLIEKLAAECAFALLDEFPLVQGVKITVCKPDAPVKYKVSTVGVSFKAERERVYLSLGSSEGDRKKYLDTALEKLNATRGIKVKKVSSYMRSAPYGGVAENEFLNCAAEIETYLSPFALLDEIHRIEAECGRVRKKRWGDRTLDIDIIFYGSRVINTDRLSVPHPDYAKRDFVVKPLKEIAPQFENIKFCN